MNKNTNLAIGTNSSDLGNALNGFELIEATLLDNVSGGGGGSSRGSSERCRMG